MKVYIVTSGSYSDYAIERVYLDQAKAKEYAATIPKMREAQVEEYETADEMHLSCWTVINRFNSNQDQGQWVELASVPPSKDQRQFFRYHSGGQAVMLTRTVDREPDEAMKARMMKAAQDIYWQCQNLWGQGRTVEEINKVLANEI